ncbi:hypothetical protein [Pelagibacterium lentulum]|uniref:Uncharacterized protein n=1 Tax=Pelagibacterium lentulum TaxID=2029865 RepID=A0A916VWA8_9HYPH|nr:hypothetical protein [Pelagibacterium lentulum]GGA45811.1 hypothetical protein GCM10011499_14430 [Pelagibacterium lentulum]
MTDITEIMARALWPLQEWGGIEHNAYLAAQAAISALNEAGYVIVPKEPSIEMIAAFWRQKNTGTQEPGLMGPDRDDYSAYRAMIEASKRDE